MSFLMGAIGGWPPPSEYHRVERQVNMDAPLFLRNAWKNLGSVNSSSRILGKSNA